MIIRPLFIVLFFTSALISQVDRGSDSIQLETLGTELHPGDYYKLGTGYVNHPIRPPVTTSPRATLYSFIESMNRAYDIVMEAQDENLQSSGFFTPKEVYEKAEQAEVLFKRAVECLDLHKLPEALKKDLSYEKTLLLKEILDRIELPPFSEVPNELDIEQEAELEKVLELDSWQIPNADIVIAKVEEGPRKGEYLFTARTVDRLDEYFDLLKDIPYKKDEKITADFYNFYINSPGNLLPPKWISYLPDSWSSRTYFSQTILQWVGLFLAFFLIAVGIRFLFIRLLKPTANQSTKMVLFRKGLFLFLCALFLAFLRIVDETFLNITGTFLVWTRLILSFITWILLAGAVYFFINSLSELLISSKKLKLEGIQQAYTKIISLLLSLLVAIFVFIIGLSRLGLSLLPLLTGAGIGGIAIALAARSTLENVISSFTIFSNKPFRLGHEIEIEGFRGTVIDIGLSKTKIRQLNGRIAIIPNKNIIDATVENIEERPFWRKEMEIILSYSEDPEKVRAAVKILREILSVDENKEQTQPVQPNSLINQPGYPPRVFFQGIKGDNQVLKVYYWYCSSDKWSFREHEDYINFQIVDRFKEASIEFAIPAQSVRFEPRSGSITPTTDQNISSANPKN